MSNLTACLENVTDEKTFIYFLEALHKDATINKDEWHNGTIKSYLESCTAWYKDSKHIRNENPQHNPWRLCAEILYCGKIYE